MNVRSLLSLILCCCTVFVWMLSLQTASAYICNKDQSGPLSVTIEKIEKVTKLDTPYDVKVVFKNESDAAVAVSLACKSIEQVTVALNEKTVNVPAKGTAETVLQVKCGAGTYNAHYPVHVFAEFEWEGAKHVLHPVQAFETDFGAAGVIKKSVGKSSDGREIFIGEMIEDASQLPLLVVPDAGGIALTETDAYRVTWQRDRLEGQASGSASNTNPEVWSPKPEALPIGWQGSDKTSSAHFSKESMTRGGVSRKSLSIHPPYQGGAGTMFTEYLVQLPKTTPITFSSFLAMRDIAPTEPESDGVTFAVWVGDEKIGEKHCTSKTWVPFEVDLSKFAGQTVLLRLQSDPGPKRDTTCDSAFWGTPLLRVGEAPKLLTAEEKKALFEENAKAITNPDALNPKYVQVLNAKGEEFTMRPRVNGLLSKQKESTSEDNQFPRTFIYELEGEMYAVITMGNYGFLDGVIGIGNKQKFVQYDGLRVEIEGQPLGTELSALAFEKWESKFDTTSGFPNLIHELKQQVVNNGKQLNMSYAVKCNKTAIQLTVNCDDPLAITKIEFGPATRHANRVYFGHGYCITEPERFEVTNGGHTLSTSHVGFDFDNGLSLLMATTTPPDRLTIDPASKTYTLSVCPGTTMTLLPGTSGAMDCAIRYRPLYDKQPSAGVAKKAGRFVFDVWGGRYGEQLKKIQQQIDYGVTDALFVNHNWQRWGYDNRLPDIWPPNPRFGTLDEVKQLNELCKKHGILYGLHDNYIDIYPDADGYNFDVVSFNENGQPRKAWNNYGIEAQSYQLRPDRLMPFLERNFNMMMPELPLSAYFVDVFSSINLHEFWDRDGNKHGRMEMLANWCKAFDRIRERLGNGYPTISEAGSDFLIGHLDGADCQFLTLSDEPGDFKIVIHC
ncbi:MAG: hypothetical protein FWC50_08140, partial [Planctomycetaceae bacterium]|nr:hypothetical protein [Planctomycetaceae bacterium]